MQTETLASIKFVTDDDTGMWYTGEVEGGFNDLVLEDYLRTFGLEGYVRLVTRICGMHSTLQSAWVKVETKELDCGNDL